VKVEKKYIGDRVQRKRNDQKKAVFGTIVEMRQNENLGKRFNSKYRDERYTVYLVKWDRPVKESYSWVASHLLTPLWPGVSKNGES